MTILSDNLKYFRKEAKMTQKELEAKSGVSQTAITKYENDRWVPKKATLLSLANALEVPYNVLLTKQHHYADIEDYDSFIESIRQKEAEEEDRIEQQELYYQYLDSEEQQKRAIEELEIRHSEIDNLFFLINQVRDEVPHSQYESVMKNANSLLDDYERKNYDEIYLLTQKYDKLYDEISMTDKENIFKLFSDILKKHGISNLKDLSLKNHK
ncbi:MULTISPECIES: helix-turn-helix domain-containing protein [unclassified Breznakia]|uniref:helix-turn-helix domain-containing protein n=1 Tax=unclassified Breznakia TaxID=2623764 RepID=UPI002472F920|nr:MULTISPECIES: helix-turn-helix domain-containing protein [unclassified Breznakia]MDH6367036.1 transcriptional regulator with XRE-family HTH domain [Breznakia sp. PH1-1]MDH6404192.1 transcriptional regulator with XRE-family HTH domain [Breznakia sp. PF1-11]MDH6411923.1 transcriptional regulator with XRE-family HTH domain [Breznakia sp. PFB1-11]MDH6414180.1 transcriptional regulator with XRE-family HTH domain [Breznakia sp. PFB1-14]MDH6415997.1 transcriptional regulator with XRE-family HTH do